MLVVSYISINCWHGWWCGTIVVDSFGAPTSSLVKSGSGGYSYVPVGVTAARFAEVLLGQLEPAHHEAPEVLSYPPISLPVVPPITNDWAVEDIWKPRFLHQGGQSLCCCLHSHAHLWGQAEAGFSWSHFLIQFLPLDYFASFTPVHVSPESKNESTHLHT